MNTIHNDMKDVYGEEVGNHTYKAYKELANNPGIRELKAMESTELLKMNSHVCYINAYHYLELNVHTLCVKEMFVERWKEEYGTHALLAYSKTCIPLLSQFTLDELSDENFNDEVMLWMEDSNMLKGDKTIHINVLILLDANEPLISMLRSTNSKYTEYKDDFRRFIHKHGRITTEQRFKSAYNMLVSMSPLDSINDIPLDKALDFCMQRSKYSKFRILLLQYFGYNTIDDINKEKIRHKHVLSIYNTLKDKVDAKCRFSMFFGIDKAIGGIENVCDKDVEYLAKFTNGYKMGRYLCYCVIMELLEEDKRDRYDSLVSHKAKKILTVDVMKMKNEWLRGIMTELEEEISIRSNSKSAYPENDIRSNLRLASKTISCIEQYVAKHYKDKCKDQYSVKWFLYNCTLDMMKRFMLDCGKDLNVHNDRVKSTVDTHHARGPLIHIMRFFKYKPINSKLLCKDTLSSISISNMLTQIENKRVPADPNIRRELTNEEMDRLLEVVKNDPFDNLLVNLLREVALRSGAVTYLKWKDIINEHDQPRHTCKVLEKMRRYREFVTSPNLKKAIVTYIHTYPTDDKDVYVFFVKYRTKPSNSVFLGDKLKKMATAAGIDSSRVYTHMFRHTLVSNLMSKGNSSEVVSKYMGHANVQTTMKYYWTTRVEDLIENMKSPFVNYEPTEEEVKEEESDKVSSLNKRIDTAIGIIYVYQEQMHKAHTEGLGIEELQYNIKSQIPNIKDLLRCIVESQIDTSSAYSSMTSSESFLSSLN